MSKHDRWAVESRLVEKPWGWELIWAHTDTYVGKVLFVRAGQSLSLQYHEQKDESWYVQSGLARLELGEVGATELDDRLDRRRRLLPLRAGHRAPGHGRRGHDHPRGLDAAPRRRRPASRTRTAAPARPNLDRDVLGLARWTG